MSSYLCTVCALISTTRSDFWSSYYDSKEYCQETWVELQSYRCMRRMAERGCRLCSVLLDYPTPLKVGDENATLILRRCPAYSDQAVRLGTGPKGTNYITRTFYRQVPAWWWDLPSPTASKTGSVPESNHPATLDGIVDNIQIMKTWLHNCQSSHKACSKGQKQFLPTRLLDLHAFANSPDIRLIETKQVKAMQATKNLRYPDYLALSHCWGADSTYHFKTNDMNYEERLEQIAVRDLPKTFYDAVYIARSLDQRYLWIDSLCVIQGSKEDWAEESGLMADVYGNACCTLSALSSENGLQGCRMTTDIQKSTGNSFFDYQIRQDAQTHVRLYRQLPAVWAAEYGEEAEEPGHGVVRNPLRYRAWTLQEAELSRRTIFFAEKQLLWRCRQLKGTTELPWIEQLPDEVFKMRPWPLCDGLQDDQTEGYFSSTRLQWYQLVEDYSLRSLTYDSDKLIAIAGLANEYQQIFPGAQYVAGMWGAHIPRMPLFRPSDNPRLQNDPRHKLHAGAVAIGAHCSATLLWRSLDRDALRYKEYIAPTWSWASIKGRVSYDSQRIEPHGNSFDRMGVLEEVFDCDFGGMRWEGMNAKTKNIDPFGAIEQGAYLSLRNALLAKCSVPNEPSREFFKETKGTKTRIDSIIRKLMENLPPIDDTADADGEALTMNGKTIGVFFRDSADDALAGQDDIFCLRIRGEPFFSVTRHRFKNEQEADGENMVMGIILIRTWSEGSEEVYKRIGLARWVNAALFQNGQPVDIKLI